MMTNVYEDIVVKEKVNRLREEIQALINDDLADKEHILKLSRKLDKLIIKLQKRLNHTA